MDQALAVFLIAFFCFGFFLFPFFNTFQQKFFAKPNQKFRLTATYQKLSSYESFFSMQLQNRSQRVHGDLEENQEDNSTNAIHNEPPPKFTPFSSSSLIPWWAKFGARCMGGQGIGPKSVLTTPYAIYSLVVSLVQGISFYTILFAIGLSPTLSLLYIAILFFSTLADMQNQKYFYESDEVNHLVQSSLGKASFQKKYREKTLPFVIVMPIVSFMLYFPYGEMLEDGDSNELSPFIAIAGYSTLAVFLLVILPIAPLLELCLLFHSEGTLAQIDLYRNAISEVIFDDNISTEDTMEKLSELQQTLGARIREALDLWRLVSKGALERTNERTNACHDCQ